VCDFYGTGACADVACTSETASDLCTTNYCNLDSVCASCNGNDDNCPEDYECDETTCVKTEGLSTGALIAIIVCAVLFVLIMGVISCVCIKAKKEQGVKDKVLSEALTQNERSD
jgi:hypothetical protein